MFGHLDLIAAVEEGPAAALVLGEALPVVVQLLGGDVPVQALALEEGPLLLVPNVLVLLHVEVPVPAHRLKHKWYGAQPYTGRYIEANANACCRSGSKVLKLSGCRRGS